MTLEALTIGMCFLTWIGTHLYFKLRNENPFVAGMFVLFAFFNALALVFSWVGDSVDVASDINNLESFLVSYFSLSITGAVLIIGAIIVTFAFSGFSRALNGKNRE